MAPRDTVRLNGKQDFAMELPTAVGRLSSASAQKIRDMDRKGFEAEAWQEEAYLHIIAIGGLGYVVNLQADTVAGGTLRVIERDLETGQIIEPDHDETGAEIHSADREKAERVALALRGPGGGASAILHGLASADIVAGEGYLLGEPIPETNQLSWEVVSVVEITADRDGNLSRKKRSKGRGPTDSVDGGKLDDDTYVSRYHRRDLMHSGDPTSPLRRVASECREVILLSQLLEATIKSHIPAGALYVPNEVTFPGAEDEGGDDDEYDPMLEALVAHLSAPIADRRSAAALVPLIMSGPAEFADKVKMISLKNTSVDISWVLAARDSARASIAIGIDVPPEVMDGKGGLNHWTGANVDQDFIEKHTVPIGHRCARFLTISYLRRMLVDSEDMSEEDAERFEFVYDASELLTRADAADSADRLWADMLISDDARIRARGFEPDEVRVSTEEKNRRILEAAFRSASASGKPFLAAIIGREALIEMGISPENVDAMLTAAPPGAASEEVEKEMEAEIADETKPPSEPELKDPSGGAAPDESLAIIMERIRSTGEYTLERTLEKVANLAIGKLPKDSTVTKDQIRRLPKLEVLHKIPEADWQDMGMTPERMLRDAWSDFSSRSRFWLATYYETKDNLDPLAADEKASRIVSEIVLALNTTALSAFKRPLDRQDGMLVTTDVVLDALVS